MSFWSDLSPLVKGVIVVGVIGGVVLGWMAMGLPPFDEGTTDTTQTRGVDVNEQVTE